MFRDVGNGQYGETYVSSNALAQVQAALPNGWDATWSEDASQDSNLDGRVQLRSPQGQDLVFATEVRSSYRGPASELVRRVQEAALARGLQPLLLIEYANKAVRDASEAQEVSIADTTGWVSLSAAGPPGLYIKAQGADRAPFVRSSTINRLDGPGAGRVIRTLWDLNDGATLPSGVRELAKEAGVSAGTVSKILPALETFGAVERDDSGRILRRDRRLLLERWVQDYSFVTSNRQIGWFLAPRGVDDVRRRISTVPAGMPLAMTGPQVAAKKLQGRGIVPVVPLTLLAYYTPDIERLRTALDVTPASNRSAANLVIAQPRPTAGSDVMTPFAGPPAAIPEAPLPQVLADLMTLGGRYPDLAEQTFQELNLGRQ